jgi:hypothetical protein
LFNLIFAMRIALLQGQVTTQEVDFFFRQLLQLPDFHEWRRTEVDFFDMESVIPRQKISRLKRDLGKLFPEHGRQLIERLEDELGEEIKYGDVSMRIFALFSDENSRFGKLSLMQQICLGFLCPDHEFKSKLTEFVYTNLSEVFEFTEECSRLHQFLRRASWTSPIAL